MKTFYLFLAALLPAAIPSLLSAQTAMPPADGSDGQWAKISHNDFPSILAPASGVASPQGAGATADPQANTARANQFLQRADDLKAYYTQNPSSTHGSEAHRLEALSLLYAQFDGLSSVGARCDALVKQVRADPSLPAADRFVVASQADLFAAERQIFATENARLLVIERTLRNLVQEFPDLPAAAEGLLRLAEDSDDVMAVRIAGDLLKMDIPPQVKDRAQLLLDRYALIGQSLQSLLGTAPAIAHLPARAGSGATVLYVWSTTSNGVYNGKQIAAAAVSNATIIGLNADVDESSARALAGTAGLPGLQIYSPTGLDSKLAQQLQPSGHDLLLIADRKGIIRSVSSHDFAAKISAANQ